MVYHNSSFSSLRLVLAATAAFLTLSGCLDREKVFKPRHTILVGADRLVFDGGVTDSAAIRDSLHPFCTEKAERHVWLLEGEKGRTATDFVNFLRFVTALHQDCRGLFALDTARDAALMQPPVPVPRSYYSFDMEDSSRPRLSLMVVAERSRIRLWARDGWLPEIPLVRDTLGRELVASDKPGMKVRPAWIDRYGRCAVEARRDVCADSLWKGTKYALLGDQSMVPDTLHPENEKEMIQLGRVPLTRELAVRGEIHAFRTLPGSLPPRFPNFHGVFGPDLEWDSLLRLLTALRKVGIDFNTVEILQ
jgi:hypothetical protein